MAENKVVQIQFLNKLLSSKDTSLLTLNNLDVSYFSDFKQEYNYIKNHMDKYGNVPDTETFLSVFPQFQIFNVNESDSFLLESLQKDKNTRTIAYTFNKVKSLIMQGKDEEAEALYKEGYDSLSSGAALSCVDITKDTSRYDAYVERTRDFDKYYISTGFKELDDVIGGWNRETENATIAARPNVGKSFIALYCAKSAVEQGLTVGLYSGEMPEREVGYRFDTLAGHIPNGSLIHGNENVANDYKKWMDSLPTRYKGSLKVLTPPMINGPATISALRAFIKKEELDILFIDQYSLLEDERHGRSDVERYSNLSKDIKNLQVMEQIPIIAVSQQNRAKNENGEIDLTNVAQSDRIGQDSTIVLFLEKKDDVLKMHLVKSRDSANGVTLKYMADFNNGKFTYMKDEEEDDKEEEEKPQFADQETKGVDAFV